MLDKIIDYLLIAVCTLTCVQMLICMYALLKYTSTI
nr:MAG TPA: hypothetical protein [Caudoviricetes sp.]